jgi:hypothetical protein
MAKKDDMSRTCSTNGEKRISYRILVGNLKGKIPLGKHRRSRDNDNKMDLREIVWGSMDYIDLS